MELVHLTRVPNKPWRVIYVNAEGKNTLVHFDNIEDAALLLNKLNITHDEIDEALIRSYTVEGNYKAITSVFVNRKFTDLEFSEQEKIH